MAIVDRIRNNRDPLAACQALLVIALFMTAGCGPTPAHVEQPAPVAAPAVGAPAAAGDSSSVPPATGTSVPAESAAPATGSAVSIAFPSVTATEESTTSESTDPEPSDGSSLEETSEQATDAPDDSAVIDETDLESRPETPDLPEDDQSHRYEFRDLHDPDGIGKFYMGREIAWVMGFAAAPWLERPEREKEEATSKLLKALDLKQGMIVADIGAGSGVLSLPIAKRVAPRGKVYAVDVQQEMLDRLSARARSRNIRNVELVLGTEKSPRLKKESIDLALMVDVYHEFAHPYEMMREIAKAMKVGGRVVFVEFRMEDPKVPIKLVHKMTEEQVKKEIGLPEFHLTWKETIGTLPWQHVIVFEKQEHGAAPAEKESNR